MRRGEEAGCRLRVAPREHFRPLGHSTKLKGYKAQGRGLSFGSTTSSTGRIADRSASRVPGVFLESGARRMDCFWPERCLPPSWALRAQRGWLQRQAVSVRRRRRRCAPFQPLGGFRHAERVVGRRRERTSPDLVAGILQELSGGGYGSGADLRRSGRRRAGVPLPVRFATAPRADSAPSRPKSGRRFLPGIAWMTGRRRQVRTIVWP
jgi:hypothetical protein